jgi:hypothetical protein
MLDFMKQVPNSPVAIVIRLLLSEGHKHPDLVDYYYENVVNKGLLAIAHFVERGVDRGEFKKSALDTPPQLFLAPMMLSVIWKLMFTKRSLDTDKLMETQMDMILAHIKA